MRPMRRGARLTLGVLVAVTLVTPAWADPRVTNKPAPSTQRSVCGGPTDVKQAAGAISAEDIAAYFGEKVADKLVDLAADKILSLIGLDKIFGGDDPNAQILEDLQVIDGKLDALAARLTTVTSLSVQILDQIHQLSVDFDLESLCKIKNAEAAIFASFYTPWVQAGVTLGNALKANGQAPTAATAQAVKDAKSALSDLQDAFKAAVVTRTSDSGDISDALVPGSDVRTSLVTAYGKVLLGRTRYMTSVHSEALLHVYAEFSQVEALASWMAVEYFKAIKSPAAQTTANAYLKQVSFERASLPTIIPPGVVVDLGSDPSARTTTHHKPLWVVPTTEALCWLPDNANILYPTSGSPFPSCGQVDQVIAALNGPHQGQSRGEGWRVPTMVQLTALLSETCLPDPTNPAKFATSTNKCTSPLGGSGTTRVSDFLASVNPKDDDWQQAFCGPSVDGCIPKPHVWTRDVKVQETLCGREAIIPWTHWYRSYRFYTGYQLLATNLNDLAGVTLPSAWQTHGTNVPGLPRIPDKYPGYDGLIAADPARQQCDQYMVEMYRGGSRFFKTPSPLRLGAVIATRSADGQDLSDLPADEDDTVIEQIDYMAQVVSTRPK